MTCRRSWPCTTPPTWRNSRSCRRSATPSPSPGSQRTTGPDTSTASRPMPRPTHSFPPTAAQLRSHTGERHQLRDRSFQKLGLIPAVYIRVIHWVGAVELVDQLVQPGGQDDDVAGGLWSGVAEGVRDARRHEHGGASPGDELPVLEPEPERAGE